MRAKINLDTLSKINAFVEICSKLGCEIKLVDGGNYCVNAKSLLGACLAAMDWTQIFVESPEDIYQHIREFVVE